ncbi:MAG: HypC/HybG/HupF family hydrogenase formation chaperone [Gaiellales bacterium]|nr:MAG: HypC/HybG/HupF family hydrogenase formation chaperone [Gaiellales bacterium]
MCLAVPARIVEIDKQMATVEIGGSRREASLVLLPDASMGDYVLLHAGFAISRIDEAEALETLRLFRAMLGEGNVAEDD